MHYTLSIYSVIDIVQGLLIYLNYNGHTFVEYALYSLISYRINY